MTSREDQILKPRDPSIEDENEWEEFSLTDVKVLIPGKSRYANLLATSPENPVRVIGCLNEVEEEQEHLGASLPAQNTRILRFFVVLLARSSQSWSLIYLSHCL